MNATRIIRCSESFAYLLFHFGTKSIEFRIKICLLRGNFAVFSFVLTKIPKRAFSNKNRQVTWFLLKMGRIGDGKIQGTTQLHLPPSYQLLLLQVTARNILEIIGTIYTFFRKNGMEIVQLNRTYKELWEQSGRYLGLGDRG